MLHRGYIGVMLYRGYIGVIGTILGLYGDNGRENGNYYNALYRDPNARPSELKVFSHGSLLKRSPGIRYNKPVS